MVYLKGDKGERFCWNESKFTGGGGGGNDRRKGGMIRDGWLVSGGERASPYKALPRGSSATVSLVENIRRRGKTRVSWKHRVLFISGKI